MSDYPQKLKNIGIELLTPFTRAKAKHSLKCMECSHCWEATPISKIQSYKKHKTNGCPRCNDNRKNEIKNTKRQVVFEKLTNKGIRVLDPDYVGEQTTQKKIKFQNLKCGHIFKAAPGNILHRDVICPVCNTERKRKTFQEKNKRKHEKWKETASEWEIYKSSVYSLTEQTFKMNEHLLNPHDHPRGLAGTPGSYQLDHIFPVRWCFEQHVPAEAVAHISNLQFIPWEDNLAKKHRLIADVIPESILPYYNENEAANCIFELRSTFDKNSIEYSLSCDLLAPYKVNIFIPSTNLAIRVYDVINEVEQQVLSKKVQRNLLNIANVKGVRLIQIFSDEWRSNSTLIINKILYLIGKENNNKIHARNCVINEVPPPIKNTFLELFHTQGPDKAKINIGAYHPNNPDRLIAVMTFCAPREPLGGKKVKGKIKWELSRFATDTSLRIPGIASKLLTYFKRNYQWDEIYSYADKRWSQGNLYKKLGFTEILPHNPPAYWYVINGQRKHRWGYRKDALKNMFDNYDPNQTEYENMLKNGYDRVWDCGTIKFEMIRN